MADVHFKTEFVPKHALALAQRAAVLRAITPKIVPVNEAAVEAAVFRTLQLWRRRCNVLKKAGWEAAKSVKFQYMRNCPPTCVSMRPVGDNRYTRPCNVMALCPWCWARFIVKRTWDAVVPAMEAAGSLFSPDRIGYPYKLCVLTAHGRMEDSGPQPRALLDQMSGQLTRSKRLWAPLAKGSAFLAVVHPTKAGWAYSTRVLALMPKAYQPIEGMRVVAEPTRRGVAEAVARFARYPVGMMYGDPVQTIRLLNERSRYRLLRTAGVFHGNPSQKGADPDDDTRYLDL